MKFVTAISSTRSRSSGVQAQYIGVAKLQVFDEIVGKVSEFVTICKLFLRIRMRRDAVKEQIQ